MTTPTLNQGTLLAGIAALLGPSPISIANLGSQLLTGQGLAQNVAQQLGAPTPKISPLAILQAALTQPATGTANIGPDRSGTVISEGGFFRDPRQLTPQQMRVGQFMAGGPVSSINIFS